MMKGKNPNQVDTNSNINSSNNTNARPALPMIQLFKPIALHPSRRVTQTPQGNTPTETNNSDSESSTPRIPRSDSAPPCLSADQNYSASVSDLNEVQELKEASTEEKITVYYALAGHPQIVFFRDGNNKTMFEKLLGVEYQTIIDPVTNIATIEKSSAGLRILNSELYKTISAVQESMNNSHAYTVFEINVPANYEESIDEVIKIKEEDILTVRDREGKNIVAYQTLSTPPEYKQNKSITKRNSSSGFFEMESPILESTESHIEPEPFVL